MANYFGKRYHVLVHVRGRDGQIGLAPLKPDLTPGGIPDGDTTRYQAKKLLRRALKKFPSARLNYHQFMF